ncbi:hypothetical protein EJB05_08973 [Eragrostis curvula]|uniref:RWP-RK domain-containing protein n=1 Tax=Eragrostis curvula TaxID=38414 RepID=A0A5J9W305_9POAL|nr:hypothetical protein EJB05_08973 [Eragrostis curvula]
MAPGRRVCSPAWSDIHGLLHMRLNDAAAVLHISSTRLKLLCRRYGLARWPGKKIRSLNAKLEKLSEEAIDAREGTLQGAAARRPLGTIAQENGKVLDDLVAVYAQIESSVAEMWKFGGDGTMNLPANSGVPVFSGANN